MPSQRATQTIPAVSRFLLTTLEPIFTIIGSILILTNPGFYISGLTRESTTTIDSSTNFIYTQLAGGWAVICFSELVILRFVDDVRLWKLICMAILMSDALYTHSLAQALGGWSEWIKVGEWTGQDWAVALGTWPFLVARLMIVLGIGFKGPAVKKD